VSPLEQAIAEQRARLLAIEQQRTREIASAYAAVGSRLARNLAALTTDIEQATAAGAPISPSWLFAQQRTRILLTDLATHTDTFLAAAAKTVAGGQRTAVQDAFEDGRRLAKLALGPGPRDVLVRIEGAWDRLPAPALDLLIGRASDGSPLGDLLREIAPLAPDRVRDTLAYGVAAGKGPRVIAREVQAAANVTRNRALVIARTEIVGAHREATTQTWKQTGIVERWQWSCAKDTRTCAACWAQDGTVHPVDEPMGSHPQCRCGRIPVTPSWAELGFTGIPDNRPSIPTGAEVFATLPEADKLAILGQAKLDAYNTGQITLADLVARTHSPRWGDGVRVASLAEALA
jgi:SPP1 gp7 family putative phage head morphogenesis protein